MYKSNGWDTDAELLLLAMQEELGEVTARFLAEHPGYKKDITNTSPISEEIGDLVTLVLAFCNKQNIDAERWVENTINKRKNQS
ncbi:MazG nucleotide pyrophosphohydrolase domain-containing protein [Patescibacteria group bacterium]